MMTDADTVQLVKILDFFPLAKYPPIKAYDRFSGLFLKCMIFICMIYRSDTSGDTSRQVHGYHLYEMYDIIRIFLREQEENFDLRSSVRQRSRF